MPAKEQKQEMMLYDERRGFAALLETKIAEVPACIYWWLQPYFTFQIVMTGCTPVRTRGSSHLLQFKCLGAAVFRRISGSGFVSHGKVGGFAVLRELPSSPVLCFFSQPVFFVHTPLWREYRLLAALTNFYLTVADTDAILTSGHVYFPESNQFSVVIWIEMISWQKNFMLT